MSAELTSDTIAVGDRDGLVLLSFPKPVQWVTLDPETARNVAEAIARRSYKARFGDDPTPQRTAITDALRTRCVNRAKLMLRSMAGDGTDFDVQAQRIVDQILTEAA